MTVGAFLLVQVSTAGTYLHPPPKRPNLQLVTKALVHRVLFDGKRAAGVEFSRASVMPAVLERRPPPREC